MGSGEAADGELHGVAGGERGCGVAGDGVVDRQGFVGIVDFAEFGLGFGDGDCGGRCGGCGICDGGGETAEEMEIEARRRHCKRRRRRW